MSGPQKALNVVAVLLIAYAVIVIVAGVALCFGASVPGVAGQSIEVDGSMIDAAALSTVLGATLIVSGVMYLIIGLLGRRGAKNPRKIGAFFVLAVIGVILGVVSAVMGILQGSLPLSQFVGLLVIIVCAALAYTIKQQRV